MLFKKTLKVASATALWMVALLGANSAMAQAQDTAMGTPAVYSAETLGTATGTSGGPFYAIEIASGDSLIADFAVGARARFWLAEAAADSVHLRVATSGVLRFSTTAPTVNILTADTDNDGNLEVGADLSSTCATTLPAPASGWRCDIVTDQDGVLGLRVTIAEANDPSVSGPGTGGITVGIYDERADAHFGEGTPYQSTNTNIVQVKSSVTPMGAAAAPAGPYTATATSLFTMLKEFSPPAVPAPTRPFEVSFGGFNVALNMEHLDATTGANMSGVTDLWTHLGVNGTSRFASPGGWAFASGFRLASETCAGDGPDGSDPGPQDGDGAGITSSPLSEEDPTDDVMGGLKIEPWVLCVTISNENDEVIAEGAYTVDVNLARKLGDPRPFPPAGKAGIHAATVRHDGTRVQIPYVTSYDGYTQRIVIVNRNKVDVSYSLTFHVEGDGMLEGDNPHEGMAMGDQATVLKVDELVTLTGPTRAAATLVVAAESGTVDVATTMVNKMDQSTDTVVLTSN